MNLIFSKFGLIFISSFLSFSLSALLAPTLIKILKKYQFGAVIKEETLMNQKTPLFNKLHKKKTGTPTMGGLLIWIITALICFASILLVKFDITSFSLINRNETYIALFTLVSLGILGAVDDIFNVKKIGKVKGLSAKVKMIFLLLISFIGGLWFYFKLDASSILVFGNTIELGLLYIPLFMFVITGTANAVNFTDGLDGLAGGLSILSFISYAIVAYFQGLFLLATLCIIIASTTLGFLWHNIPPAKFFMGDTGSLALGGTLGVIAMLTNTVALLPFIAFIFVIETLSVIIQLTSKKLFGKKVFLIAPIHHHFEAKGWPEFKVTMRFWIIGTYFACLRMLLPFYELI